MVVEVVRLTFSAAAKSMTKIPWHRCTTRGDGPPLGTRGKTQGYRMGTKRVELVVKLTFSAAAAKSMPRRRDDPPRGCYGKKGYGMGTRRG